MSEREIQLTQNDLIELLEFDEVFHARGFYPVERTGGGDIDGLGVMNMPFPIYAAEVDRFIDIISSYKWCDYQYDPLEQEKYIENPFLIDQASLPEIRSLLTYVHRGERFCDGHIAEMITSGIVKRIFARLRIILNELDR